MNVNIQHGGQFIPLADAASRLVKDSDQKLNLDYPATTPRGGIGTARVEPNHVSHVDLTVVPIGRGFWVSWLPMAIPQCWPFCWWVTLIVDHFSRRVMGVAVFPRPPNSEQVRAALGQAITQAKVTPKYIVCDKGSQFWSPGFKTWCKRRGIRPRYGAIGKHGGIAVVERAILTMKCLLGALAVVPLRREAFRRELILLFAWCNEHRPHTTLSGKTPNEAYFKLRPANRQPRYVPRSRWPRGSPCSQPWALVRGKAGAKMEPDVEFLGGRKHLPIVRLKRAA